MSDEFYIGWEDHSPAGIGRTVRRCVGIVLLVVVGLAVWAATSQRTIGTSVFEWGTTKSFAGIFQARPYPHLLVPRPGAVLAAPRFSTYYLVKPFKFGLDPAIAKPLDGKQVRLKGTLIYRGDQTMIEVVPDSLHPDAGDGRSIASDASLPTEDLGTQTLVGEIVDSKCYLGVMNPGRLTPHRACAIRCISGGIPPVLLVRQKDGGARYCLLVDRDSRPVNRRILDLVAEPVTITGEVERQGDWLILRADPKTYRRVSR